MTEELYRWVEAIANRREYIETQLAPGSPVVLMETREGLLLLTFGRERQKLFEIYDRIALGAIGHPADIERLRILALEVASAEGFSRSPDDVSLRRLVSYSMAPAVKAAFEQVYGAPYLARLLLVELGRHGQPNHAMTLDYDGSFESVQQGNGRPLAAQIAGAKRAGSVLKERLAAYDHALSLPDAVKFAARSWASASLASGATEEIAPTESDIDAHLETHSAESTIEGCLLAERDGRRACFHRLSPEALKIA